jgi:hypothetical protein
MHVPITADTYEYTKNIPTFTRDDDAKAVRDLCLALGYNYYTYGGMVMQIEPDHYIQNTGARWFISFTELNNGRQIFYEASGNGMVFNAERDADAFKHYLAFLQDNVDKAKARL